MMNIEPSSMTMEQMMAIMKELADLRIQRDILMGKVRAMEQELTRVQPKQEEPEQT